MADVGMLRIDLMNYQCGILLKKKIIFTLESDPFFARGCFKTIFLAHG